MDLILHHYDFSNYAEKVRLALGFKGFDWYSVIIPSTAPKPELTPLTGGYRRTPVLQIGADIFCDTRRIMLELERLQPEPTFYPPGLGEMANMISYWAENQLFRPISLYVSGSNLDVLPNNLQADRSRMRGMPEPSPETVCRAGNRNAPLARLQINWVDSLFADGRDWAAGAAVTVADFALYHALWFLTARTDRLAFELENCLHIQSWMARIEQFGHGARHEISAQMALDAAAEAEPIGNYHYDTFNEDPPRGAQVRVRADDYGRDPVEGELVELGPEKIGVRRWDQRASNIVVHFPRLGYDLRAIR
ncbi:MAG: glutathione S-transferase [Rickettsiales bacterium]|nr:glutathione S-transferase [Rickettsiales bacterium]|tara:strand:+ start:838 stop:1758 length:921 start_codon:yes stop_codon:yes gene_type:complete